MTDESLVGDLIEREVNLQVFPDLRSLSEFLKDKKLGPLEVRTRRDNQTLELSYELKWQRNLS